MYEYVYCAHYQYVLVCHLLSCAITFAVQIDTNIPSQW